MLPKGSFVVDGARKAADVRELINFGDDTSRSKSRRLSGRLQGFDGEMSFVLFAPASRDRLARRERG